MTITVGWDNPEQTIIRCDLSGIWTWEEVEAAQEQIVTIWQSVPHTIDLIVDLSHSPHLPDHALWHIRRLRRKNQDMTSRIIFTGANLTGRAIVAMFQKLFPLEAQRVSLADTVADARAFLIGANDETTTS